MFQVFIGSSTEAIKYAEIVEETIDRHPLFTAQPWWKVFRSGSALYDQIISLVSQIDFAIFLTTPDDNTISRDKDLPVSRANVLLEYGIFTGHLGPENALRLHIGKTSDPSDLHGVINVTARISYKAFTHPEPCEKIQLESAVNEALAQLLKPADGCARLDIEFMRSRNYHSIAGSREAITLLLESQQHDRLRKLGPELRDYNFLDQIIKRYTSRGTHRVGLDNHTTITHSFIDFSSISKNTDDQQLLTHAFSHFIATKLLYLFSDRPPSRFAIPEVEDQIPFLAAALDHLRAKPAIVRPRTKSAQGVVQGRFFGSERSVLLQGVTSTGNTPSCCSVELFRCNLQNVALFSFIAKASHYDEIRSFCHSRNMSFHPLLLQSEDGALSVADTRES